MSTTPQCSSGTSRRSKASGANRRTWSLREEEVLISAIRELITNGFKSDNGFRPGYLARLETAMRKEFPTTDLKANPHINSKISAWKKLFYSLCGILSRFGVGFNTKGTFMLKVEDETWDSIVQVDSAARNMRYKQWPYYEVWQEIFGRDRATGFMAEDLANAAHNVEDDAVSEEAVAKAHFNEPGGKAVLEDITEGSFNESSLRGGSTSTREKKRKLSREIQEVCDVLDRIGRGAEARLDKMAGKFGYAFELDKMKKRAFDKLHSMDNLGVHQRFNICELLSKEVDKLQVFNNLSEEMLPSYVEHLIIYLNH